MADPEESFSGTGERANCMENFVERPVGFSESHGIKKSGAPIVSGFCKIGTRPLPIERPSD
jgi:hypothetical protein